MPAYFVKYRTPVGQAVCVHHGDGSHWPESLHRRIYAYKIGDDEARMPLSELQERFDAEHTKGTR